MAPGGFRLESWRGFCWAAFKRNICCSKGNKKCNGGMAEPANYYEITQRKRIRAESDLPVFP